VLVKGSLGKDATLCHYLCFLILPLLHLLSLFCISLVLPNASQLETTLLGETIVMTLLISKKERTFMLLMCTPLVCLRSVRAGVSVILIVLEI